VTEAPTRKNPYDWINPVGNKAVFAGRSEEISKIMEELEKLKGETRINPAIAVIGERRVGKTSLLRRLEENCAQHSLLSLTVNVDDRMATDVWEFWKEIFYALLSAAHAVGIELVQNQTRPMGFVVKERPTSPRSTRLLIDDLKFITVYHIHLATPGSVTLSYQIIKGDLDTFHDKFTNAGYNGVVLMLDEAHNLLNATHVKQHLRNIIQQTSGYGLVFSGDTTLGRLFTDTSEPFFGQANVVRLDNFIKINDIAECALLPLDQAELKLISPMTINYLAKLSRGKPN
jgi:Cdc6-like AAA superfamily ATPase